MPYTDITRVKPATLKGSGRRLRIFKVAFGDVIAMHDNLAHGRAIARHIAHFDIYDAYAISNHITLTLAREEACLLSLGQIIPFLGPLADSEGAVGLGQTIHVRGPVCR